jgi:hypothetical protein
MRLGPTDLKRQKLEGSVCKLAAEAWRKEMMKKTDKTD